MRAAGQQRVAIAGGGIGGLAVALALARRGVATHIYERRSDFTETGAGIQIGPNGSKVLAEIGLLDAVCTHAAEPDALSVHDGNSGRVITRLPLGEWMKQRHGAPYLTTHRHDLHGALLTAANADPRITLSLGVEVRAFANRSAGIDITLSDGGMVECDALICADGLWSRLRSQVGPFQAPSLGGKCAYRTVVPRQSLAKVLIANDVHIWLAPGVHVVHYPVRKGDEYALVVIVDGSSSVESWSLDATKDMLAASPVMRFSAPLRDMVLAAEDWRMWPLQTLGPLPRWTKGCAALLGDAAHPVLPFFAQGGGLALEDAAVLAKHIAGGGLPMPERLGAYEHERRARVSKVATASQTNGSIYHLDGLAAEARNAVLSSIPASMLMRRYDWLYGWGP